MKQPEEIIWQNSKTQQLVSVIDAIKNIDDMQNFLRDILTEKEIIEISARLEAAKMLANNDTYINIIKETKLSSRTIARISDWLKNGRQGYLVALNIIKNHQTHITPARTE